ncbi:MAG: hypothetical protein LBL47_02445 [Lactobacillus sp.]|jgi:hypothetical protein|nr:hypothetical protein [Lactobacillus sp.]
MRVILTALFGAFMLSSCMTSEGVSTTGRLVDATSKGVGTTVDASTSTTDASSGEKSEKNWEYDGVK